jgi:hypothetical protein
MVEISGFGIFVEEGSSEIGISYSAVPTFNGPGYSGNLGTGFKVGNMLEKCRVTDEAVRIRGRYLFIQQFKA